MANEVRAKRLSAALRRNTASSQQTKHNGLIRRARQWADRKSTLDCDRVGSGIQIVSRIGLEPCVALEVNFNRVPHGGADVCSGRFIACDRFAE